MTQPVRVLHVDDDPDFAEMAGAFLEREVERLQIETATDPQEGLDLLSETAFDCVVSDYDMPTLDGLEFFNSLRAEHPEIPVILFTGKGSEEVASEAISAGVTDYIQKEPGPDVYKLLANRILDAAELHRSKTNYREIFEQSPDGIVIHDPADGTMLDINTQYADLFGYEKSELLDAGFEAILPDEAPYTAEAARNRVRDVIEGGAQTFEWPGVRKDGTRFWAEVHLRPVELHGRQRVLAAVRDITERRAHEEELERARTRTTYALEATNSYIFEIDFETGQETRYGAWDSIHDIPPEEVQTTEEFIEQAVHPEDQPSVRSLHEDFEPEPGATTGFEYRTHPDRGEVKWVRARLRVQPAEDGESLRGIGLSTDVTELKEGRKALERKNERLDAFTSIVSHDLRNPLSAAEGQLEIAQRDCDSEALDAIDRAHSRIRRLIEDLLALARDGEPVTETRPIELREAVERSWQQTPTGAAEIEIETDRSVEADELRLRQILENLFANAVEHADGPVTVTVGRVADGFYVEDDGPGIPEGDREAVFESGYSTKPDGTGFGLNIVAEIAEAHDWAVTLTESEDRGARFEFTGVRSAS